jgi:Na+-translocating ferredoxin:NAD+ oxidoreductase subunit G
MTLNYLKAAWLVLAMALVFAASLAAVQSLLAPKILANQKNETYDQLPNLVAGADAVATQEVRIGGLDVYKAIDKSGRQVGWVLRAGGAGYADRIELLIGLDVPAETITGLYVLDQKETPGLGNRIAEPAWRGQFAGKDAAEAVAVTQASPNGNQIGAVSGATISSQSVCDIVNAAVAAFRRALTQEKPIP